jgi:SAM-dependent methyltransferase
MNWIPPSDTLQFCDGLWQPQSVSAVSYPEEGNEVCFQVEDSSYWFAHRNACILSVVQQFPPAGTFYDIGGGNGFVAMGLQNVGLDVALIEPGSGAKNAVKRGVKNVIWAALGDAGLQPQSLMAAGAFDVVEHIEDEHGFLSALADKLKPGGRFYCTVPAMGSLWSDEDVSAGHFRRYSRSTLSRALQAAGFEVEFISYFFTWLVAPVFLFRSLPWRLGGRRSKPGHGLDATRDDHTLPRSLRGVVGRIHGWELGRLSKACPLRMGSSLICCARKPTL